MSGSRCADTRWVTMWVNHTELIGVGTIIYSVHSSDSSKNVAALPYQFCLLKFINRGDIVPTTFRTVRRNYSISPKMALPCGFSALHLLAIKRWPVILCDSSEARKTAG